MPFLENTLSDEEINKSCPAGKDYLVSRGQILERLHNFDEELRTLRKQIQILNNHNFPDKITDLKNRISFLEQEFNSLQILSETVRLMDIDVREIKKEGKERAVTSITNKVKIGVISVITIGIFSTIIGLYLKDLF